MKCQKIHFLLFVAVISVFWAATACASKPKTAASNVTVPDQEALDRLSAAEARAQDAREKALEVRGQVHSPDEWTKAESDNEAGKKADRTTAGGVNEGIARFNAAADGYEAIAEQSGPLYAKEREDTNKALAAAAVRAGQSRKNALDNKGPTYFPADWENAENSFNGGENAGKESVDEMNAAIALYTAAADAYDDIAARSAPLVAKEKDNASAALQAAIARAEQSRKNAQDVRAQNFFPDEWRTAEADLQSARNAKKTTPDEMIAATPLFVSAANKYDSITARSRPMAAKDDAQKDFTTAITRMERSRQQAENVNGQTYFPNEWRSAEASNKAGRDAPKDTTDQIKAATAQIVSAADAYDEIAKNSGPRFAQERDEANKALQAAMTKADQARRDAMTGNAQTNFPNEWRAAEAKNQAARSAKKTTPAEMKAAVPLFNQTADAYNDIARRNAARVAEENRKKAEEERRRADEERRKAEEERRLAEAAARALESKRKEAEDTVAKAREISSESINRARTTGNTMESRRHE